MWNFGWRLWVWLRYGTTELDLQAIPLERRDPCPEDYDGEHPDKYPPKPGIEMMRR